MKTSGQMIDIHNREIYPAEINVKCGKIISIDRLDSAPQVYIMPGLIDSHIHIESSMITPGAFAKAAVRHGTVGVVSDPHEIANVLGIDGVRFMMEDAKKVPVYFWFGAPSCVPATCFETSGAVLGLEEVQSLLDLPDIKYLAEMMNFPGVIYGDTIVNSKLEYAKRQGKPVDGHAPGLSGIMLEKYVNAGISTDHECSTIAEAREKLSLGMKILIREGSAARNLNSLMELLLTDPDKVMLCSDDLHPEMLVKRHLNKIVAFLITEGFNIFDVIRCSTINPVLHYNLEAGLLRPGDSADFILVDSLKNMNVLETWIKGNQVFENGKLFFDYIPGRVVNNFNCNTITDEEIKIINKFKKFRVIEAHEGELLTNIIEVDPVQNEWISADIYSDILKIVVKDRYNNSYASAGFIKGFGLKRGAFASSIAHDSHNLISIGTNDLDIVAAINTIVRQKGGLAVSCNGKTESLTLDIGGIMTSRSCEEVALDYEKLNEAVKSLGCSMAAPFMTLSFMALLVIPELKIGDKGLFDVKKFELVPLFVD